MTWNTSPWSPPPRTTTPEEALRSTLAEALRHGANLLGRWARALQAASYARRRAVPPPVIEFHADADGQQGAVYADGRFVGFLPGVKRL